MAERLTIDKAIAHAKEVAEKNYLQGMLCHANPNDEELDKCIECGREHEQLAEWLKDLQHYKDLEEQGRLIELPCKIGDTVYGIRRFHGDRIVKSGTVSEMYFNQNMKLIIVIKNLCRGSWGGNIFGTREEAEAALKGAGE